MDLAKLSDYESEYVKLSVQGKIFIIKLQGNIYKILDSAAQSKFLLEGINGLRKQQDINALLVLNDEDVLGEDLYKQFIDHMRQAKGDQYDTESSKIIFSRYINFINQTVLNIAGLNKISFMGLRGDVVTPFIGASLVADFRFAAENTRFVFCHKKYKMHPSSALSYFLPLYINRAKYVEIMYSSCEMDLHEAKDLSLVNNIFPQDQFEDFCIEEINRILDLNLDRIGTTKLFTNFSRGSLKAYLDEETSLLH
jgi:enoyl-CoA hydratase/carnithine racemase